MSASPKIFLAASAVAALTFVAPAEARETRFVANPVPVVRARADRPTIEDADRLFADGHLKEARAAFSTIIDEARFRGDYLPHALAVIANIKYMLDDVRGAARAFDDLAAAAATYGDPATELDARFKAALMFQQTHDNRGVALQAVRIKQLLKSPAIPQETRDAIAQRILP